MKRVDLLVRVALFVLFCATVVYGGSVNLGNVAEDSTVTFIWTTNAADGSGITRATDGTIRVYKDGGTTEITVGITDTEDFDGKTGIHLCTIDLSADAAYVTGSTYHVTIDGAEIDDVADVVGSLARFGIEDGDAYVSVDEIEGTDATDAINAACDTAVSDYDGPTDAEMIARTLLAASYFDPASDTVVNVTNVATLTGHTAQTGDSFARLGAPAGASVSADVAAIHAKTTNLPGSPAAVGSPMGLADDAITSAKFDESTAYPVASADTGATQIARVGADGDTLESLSDQLDVTPDDVWDEAIAGHLDVGSTGKKLNDLDLEGNFETADSRTLTDGDETNSYTDTQTHNNTYHEVADEGVAATGTLTLVANAGDTETVTLDTKVYTFQTTLTEADCNVKIGTTPADSADNLAAAVTLGSGAGTVYAEACTAHTTVTIAVGSSVAATGILTLTGNALDTETVTFDSKVYTFQDTLTEADCNVKIGATASDSLDNLIAAVTLGSGAGTLYANACTLHSTVTAAAGTGDTLDAEAKTAGAAGNTIATTETLTNGSFGGGTLSGGTDSLDVTALDRNVAGNSIATTETLANGSFGGGTLSGGIDDQVDLYYEFDIGVTSLPHSVFFHGRFQDNNSPDSYWFVSAYDWADAEWDQISGTLDVADTDANLYFPLTGEHVGDYGGNAGLVHVRIYSYEAHQTDELYVDYLTVNFTAAGTTTITPLQITENVWTRSTRALTEPVDLTAGAVDDVWDEGDGAHQTASTMGRHLYDVVNDTDQIQGKLPSGDLSDFDESTDPVELLDSGGSAGTSAEELVDDTWNEATSGHTSAGSTCKHLADLDTSDIASVKSTVESSNAIVGHATYGNAHLVRATTPANTLDVDADGYTQADVVEINDDSSAAENLDKMLTGVAGVTITLDHLDVLSPSGNAITVTASGSGSGAIIIGGSSGAASGITVQSSNSGYPALFLAGASYGPGAIIQGTTGLWIDASTDNGLRVEGGTTGHAVSLVGGTTSGDAMHCSVTSGDEIGCDLAGSVANVVASVVTDVASRTASKADVTNLDATVSSRSSHDAADVTGGTTVATAELNIRGADSDTLETLSDQTDGIATGNTTTAIADAVWDEYASGHTTEGTFGEYASDVHTDAIAILVDTNEIQGKLPTGNLVDAAAVDTECDEALATYDGPTKAELDSAVSPLSTHNASSVWGVSTREITGGLVDTCTTNTDMVVSATLVDLMWDEPSVGHTTDGTYGKYVPAVVTDAAAILVDTNEIQGKLPSGDFVDATAVTTACTSSLNTYDPPKQSELLSAVAPLSTHTAANVWTVTTRALTEPVGVSVNNDKTGYSISGTKQTLDALNDVSAATVQTECEDALVVHDVDHLYDFWTDVTEDDVGVWRFTTNALEQSPVGSCSSQASVDAIPTVTEFNARTLLSADYFNATDDVVAHVTLVDTVTTNTNERGTDDGSTHTAASVWSVVSRGLTESVTTDNASRVASMADVSALATHQQVADLSFSTHTAANVWAVATRTVTGGTITTNTNERGTDDAAPVGAAMTLTTGERTAVRTGLALEASVQALNDVSPADVVSACTSSLTTYDPSTNADLTSAVAPLSTHSAANVATTVFATTVDGLTLEATLEVLRSVLSGKSTVDVQQDQITFYKNDGSSPKVKITYGSEGERTAVTVYD